MTQTKRTILVNNIEISVSSVKEQDYISLTDMVSGFEGGSAIRANLRLKLLKYIIIIA